MSEDPQILQIRRGRLAEIVAEVISPSVGPLVALSLAVDVADRVEHEFAASAATVNLNERPRVHRDASSVQVETVDELAAKGVAARRLTLLREVARHGEDGATCDQIEARTGSPHQTASAVLHWLEKKGLAVRNRNEKRKTRRGTNANPYVITAKGRALLRTTRTTGAAR